MTVARTESRRRLLSYSDSLPLWHLRAFPVLGYRLVGTPEPSVQASPHNRETRSGRRVNLTRFAPRGKLTLQSTGIPFMMSEDAFLMGEMWIQGKPACTSRVQNTGTANTRRTQILPRSMG